MVTTVYKAADGAEFDTLEEATKHEEWAKSFAAAVESLAMELWEEVLDMEKGMAEEAATWILKHYTRTSRT